MVWITDFGAARLSIILEKLHKLRSDRTFLYSGNFLFTLLADVDLINSNLPIYTRTFVSDVEKTS